MSGNRTSFYANLATALGWEPGDQVDKEYLFSRQDFRLIRKGRRGKIMQIITSKKDFRNQYLFDFEYLSGKVTLSQTVYHVFDPQLNLPHFILYPQTSIHHVAKFFGLRDFDIPAYKDFSANYILTGSDEPQILKIFNPMVLGFFSFEKKWTLEGLGSELQMYREDDLMKENKLSAFLQISQTIKGLFSGDQL
jgi:hypothetical protein